MASKIQNLTDGPIFSSLIKLALPLMGTSFVQMSYNLMAMFWVGRLGSKAEAAIGSIGMLGWLTSTIAILGMIAAEVSVGQSIGAKKIRRALNFASQTTTAAISLGVFWAQFYFIAAPVILSYFKLPAEINDEAVLYLRMLTVCIPFQFMSYCFSGIYNGAGRSFTPFVINSSGLLLNMILDPFFIFGIGPFPAMGLHGAALGTVIAQIYVCLFFVYNIKIRKSIIGNFTFLVMPKWRYAKRILSLGAPVSIMNSLHSFINMTLARIASIYGGHIGLMTQTTGGQIEGVTWTTSQGFSTALSAFIAQNYAAQKIERGRKAYIYAISMMLILGIFVSITFVLFGGQIFGIIVPEEEAVRSGAEYLGIMGLIQIFMMLELTTQGMFNGVGRTVPPAVINITFNALRIPLAFVLGDQMGIVGVWWAMAVTTVCKGIILPIWFSFIYRKLNRKQKSYS
ncbi:MAG: MATE family efflux transporter [Dysgonomonas sp.]